MLQRRLMVHQIEYKDGSNAVSCYLPEDSGPDKNAAAELRRLTELKETVERLSAAPGFLQAAGSGLSGLSARRIFTRVQGFPSARS